MEETKPKRIFTLTPVEDDISGVLKGARRALLEADGISYGAKALGCLILDLSMDRTANRGPGILVCSDSVLAQRFKASKTALWHWKRELSMVRFVAVKKHFMPNAWPMTKYVLLCLHPDDESTFQPTGDGMWGNQSFRGNGNHGKGARSGPECSTGHNTFKKLAGEDIEPENAETQSGVAKPLKDLTAPAQKVSRGAADFEPGSRRKLAGEPQEVGRGAAEIEPGRLKKRSLPGSKNASCPAQKPDNIRRGDSRGNRVPHEILPPPRRAGNDFERWKKTLDDMHTSRLGKTEDHLKRELAAATTPEARELTERKLAEVQTRLYGPTKTKTPHHENTKNRTGNRPSRNAGTANEAVAHQYGKKKSGGPKI